MQDQNLSVRYSIWLETHTFYTLEALGVAVTGEWFLGAKARLQRDVADLKGIHARNFANCLFDYLCLAVWGEARHAWTKCEQVILEIHETDNRRACQAVALDYDPYHFLPVIAELFEEKWASDAYGGLSWVKIAEAATHYGEWPDTVFVDHCIDLAHNNGPCFDKGVILKLGCSSFDFAAFLNQKSNYGIEEWTGKDLYLPHRVAQLVMRAQTLELLEPFVVDARHKPISLINGYTPLKWGTKHVSDLRWNDELESDEDEDDYLGDFVDEDSVLVDDDDHTDEEDYEQEEQEKAQVKVTLSEPRSS